MVQLYRLGVFDQEATGTAAQRLEYVLVQLEGAEDDDPGPGQLGVGGDLPGRGQPVQLRHTDVHEDEVGAHPLRLSHRGRAVACLPDHLDVGLRVKQRPDPGPHQRLVVGQQHLDHALSFSLRAAGTGSRAHTRKPPPAAGPAANSPPSAAARSRIPGMPLPPLGPVPAAVAAEPPEGTGPSEGPRPPEGTPGTPTVPTVPPAAPGPGRPLSSICTTMSSSR